jgi:tetratricopeptide (TPR) repeat protein
MLAQCEATQKMLILDCGHAGGVKGDQLPSASGAELGAAFGRAEGLITLASCRKEEQSREWEAKRQGLFTYFLTDGLRGAADFDRNGLVDSDELYRYAMDKVPITAQRVLNARQTPVRYIPPSVVGVFALARLDIRRQPLSEHGAQDAGDFGSLPAIEPLAVEQAARDIVEAAHVAFDSGDLTRAAEGYQRVLDQYAQSGSVPAALCGLGNVAARLQNLAGAEELFSRIIEQHRGCDLIAEARCQRAAVRTHLGRYEAALEDLRVVDGMDHSEKIAGRAGRTRVLALAGLGRYSEAEDALRRLLDGDRDYLRHWDVVVGLVVIQEEAGRQGAAARTLRRLLEEYPDCPDAPEQWFEVGQLADDPKLAAQGYYAAAQKAGKSELGLRATLRLCYCYFNMQDFPRALTTARYLQKTWPEGPAAAEGALVEARCLSEQKRFLEASAAFDRVGELPGRGLEAMKLCEAAAIAAQLQQWPKVLRLLDECLEHFDDCLTDVYRFEALLQKGEALENLGRPGEAMAFYERAAGAPQPEVAARARWHMDHPLNGMTAAAGAVHGGGGVASPSGGAPDAEGFVSLFDGRTLGGWFGRLDLYRAEDGKLVSDLGAEMIMDPDASLLSARQYGDFILRFHFRVEPGGNSGLVIRAPVEGPQAHTGMEIQILDDYFPDFAQWGRERPWMMTGAIAGVVAPKRGHLKPGGQWNAMEVVCVGSRVKVTLNGVTVVDAYPDRLAGRTPDDRDHPGLVRKHGHIGFHGFGGRGRVEYCNLRIKEL